MPGTISRTTVALVAASAGLLAAPMVSSAATGQATTPTGFALSASGYSSRVVGGNAPAGSGKSAFEVIGCTNLAGLDRSNAQAASGPEGVAMLHAARTRTWTTSVGGTVSSWAAHSIHQADFDSVPGSGSLLLSGITSLSRSFHDARGFHETRTSALGSVHVKLGTTTTSYPVPSPGKTLTIPGLATVQLARGTSTTSAGGASATNDAVTVHMIRSDTTVYLAHTQAQIGGGIRSALFHGTSTGSLTSGTGGKAEVGRTPLLVMPCAGTNGQVRHREVATSTLRGLGTAHGLGTSESASQTATTASSWQQADVDGVTLANGSLRITGVSGRASASYIKGGQVRTSTLANVALVTMNGKVMRLPAHGTLRIPGVASLERDVVRHFPGGISVIAVRVTMLDGSGATMDLGSVRTGIVANGR